MFDFQRIADDEEMEIAPKPKKRGRPRKKKEESEEKPEAEVKPKRGRRKKISKLCHSPGGRDTLYIGGDCP